MSFFFSSGDHLPHVPPTVEEEGDLIEHEGNHFTKKAWELYQKHPEKFKNMEVGKNVRSE